jgi:hypothetical protein
MRIHINTGLGVMHPVEVYRNIVGIYNSLYLYGESEQKMELSQAYKFLALCRVHFALSHVGELKPPLDFPHSQVGELISPKTLGGGAGPPRASLTFTPA